MSSWKATAWAYGDRPHVVGITMEQTHKFGSGYYEFNHTIEKGV